MRLQQKKKYLIILGVTVIICATYLLYGGMSSGQQYRGHKKHCPVMIGYIAEGESSAPLNVYSEMTGNVDILTLRVPSGLLSLIGYSSNEDAWILRRLEIDGDYHIVKLKGNKETNISFANLPADADVGSAIMCNDRLYITYEHGEHIELICYTLHGTMVWRHKLILPKEADGGWYGKDVSPDELVAVAIENIRCKEPYVYVFGKDGCIRNCVGKGSWPAFDNTGRRLVYKQIGSRTDSAVIYDLAVNAKRIVSVIPPSSMTGLLPKIISKGFVVGSIDNFLRCEWDSTSHWLVCSYARNLTGLNALYCVNIDSKKPVWQYIPVCPSNDHWIVLNKFLASAKKP